MTADSWRALVAEKLEAADWKAALLDVTPFLMRPRYAAWVAPEAILPLLR